MSLNGSRFCVQFSGDVPDGPRKTEIFYSESDPQTVRNVWMSIYDCLPPKEIRLIVGDHSKYSLEDESDFRAFMAIAEDQYRLLPAKPLHVKIVAAQHYNKPLSPPLSSPSPPPSQNEEPKEKDKAEDQAKPFVTPTRNDLSSSSTPKLEETNSKSTEKKHSTPKTQLIENTDQVQSVPEDLSVKRKGRHDDAASSQWKATQGNNLHVLSAASAAVSSLQRWHANGDKSAATFGPMANHISLPEFTTTAFVNSMQQQRLMQNSPSAPFLLQYLKNNYERVSAMQMISNYASIPKSSTRFAMPTTMDELKYYRESGRQMPSQSDTSTPMKGRRKRRTTGSTVLSGKETDCGGKRMRSSSEMSNIEFHVSKAEEFHELSYDDKQSHNSAHRSHWKHLYHVKQIYPEFIEKNKTSKYDEWSSEARDIYAITLPESYKWAFLTISKQGDNLCRRIKQRVREMKQMPPHERPRWCPTDEVLNIAMEKADERLKQLERIQETRRIKNAIASEKNLQEDSNHVDAKSTSSSMTPQQASLPQAHSFFGSGPKVSQAGQPFSRMPGISTPNLHQGPRLSENTISMAARNLHLLQLHMEQQHHDRAGSPYAFGNRSEKHFAGYSHSQAGNQPMFRFGTPNQVMPFGLPVGLNSVGVVNMNKFAEALSPSDAPSTSKLDLTPERKLEDVARVYVLPEPVRDVVSSDSKTVSHQEESQTDVATNSSTPEKTPYSPPLKKRFEKYFPPLTAISLPIVGSPSHSVEDD